MNLKREHGDKKPVQTLTTEERKPSVVSEESVKLYGETVGHSDLSNDSAVLLSQDASYRLREVLQSSCQFMKHAKRKKLTTVDFNKALKNSDVEPVYGYGSEKAMVFQHVKEADVHIVEDASVNVVNLSQKSFMQQHPAQPYLEVQWLAVEGVQKNITSPTSGKVTEVKQSPLTEDLFNYYDSITQALLGTDEELTKIALSDLRTNSRISPLLPHFCSFVANGVKTVNYDVTQLTKLLYTVHALVRNPSLYLLHHPYLTLLVQAVTYCLVEPIAVSSIPTFDHWVLRDYAAYLLAFITRECETPTNKLYSQNVLSLQTILRDDNRPLCSHYGAVRGLTLLGCSAIKDVLFSYLDSYMLTILTSMEDPSVGSSQIKVDANSVYGALLLAAEVVLKCEHMKTVHPKNTQCDPSSTETLPNALYSKLYSYFGDSLGICARNTETSQNHGRHRAAKVCLSDKTAKQTGEELLEQFLRDVEERAHEEEDMDPDEKSESKSYHSGNSEDMSFNGNLSVSVKSTVSDPEKGIKLTISMKRPSSSGSGGGKHKRRKIGQRQLLREAAEFDLPLIQPKSIAISGFKSRTVAARKLNSQTEGCEKMGKFRMLSFSKSIIGKVKSVKRRRSQFGLAYNLTTLM